MNLLTQNTAKSLLEVELYRGIFTALGYSISCLGLFGRPLLPNNEPVKEIKVR
jgi:hypothetical protein